MACTYDKESHTIIIMRDAPIGIFDSGSGGLSILNSISELLPNESFLYIGDHIYSPYGDKSTEFIKERVISVIDHFLKSGVKLIVVACNTATIAGINFFREKYPHVPIVGVVPVIKTAVSESRTKHFVVLSTNYTAKSDYQKNLIQSFAGECIVTSLGSSILVSLIENGLIDGMEVRTELSTILQKMDTKNDDVIVLGCTHYPFLVPVIRDIIGTGIKILDSGSAVARQVKRILGEREELSVSNSPKCVFYTTGDPKKVTTVFRRLLAKDVSVLHVNL